ncbi:MAG: caspase family protein [Chlamydiales bacterium]|nr:caspase family protein [Chlamydiia bacterium]MCP5506802.1 caspase family protein [Chlamydiales bacterium]
MKKLINTVLLFLLFLPCLSYAATLRGVIIGNTNDELGDYITKGVTHMEQEMRTIAAYNDLDLDLTVVTGNDFKSKKIIKVLEKLAVEPDDIVYLFSFSHGYHEFETSTPWPSIHIDSVKHLNGEGIDQLELTQILEQKHPRLLISMFSCCNNYIPPNAVPPQRVTAARHFSVINAELVKNNYRHLFGECSGTIMISSSCRGQFSMAEEEYGEIFLSAFLYTLRSQTQQEVVTWKELFEMARQITLYKSYQFGYIYEPQIEFINFASS